MEQTIQFMVTAELISAATAYGRRNALVIRLVLLCIAAACIGACYVAATRGNVILACCLFGVALFAAYLFICLQVILLKPKYRGIDHEPIETHATFTDDGFAYHNAVENFFVAWPDLLRVRKTSVYWAIHFTREGREVMIVIPSDALDGEIGRLVDQHTPKAR